MPILTSQKALIKRKELVSLGYTTVPGLMPKFLLKNLIFWTYFQEQDLLD